MKKHNILLILAVTFSSFLYCSCSEKTEGSFLEIGDGVHAAFASTIQVVEMIAEDGNKIMVPLMKGGSNSVESDVEVSLTQAASIPAGTFVLSTPTIHFNKGENVAYVVITYSDINLLVAGTTYELTLEIINKDQLSISKADKILVKAARKLTYKPIGSGTFISEWDEAEWRVDVLKAEEADVYKIKNCYKVGFDIIFSVAADNSIFIPKQLTGYVSGTHGAISFTMPASTQPQPYKTGKKFHLIGRFVVNAGSFGWFEEILVLD